MIRRSPTRGPNLKHLVRNCEYDLSGLWRRSVHGIVFECFKEAVLLLDAPRPDVLAAAVFLVDEYRVASFNRDEP